MSFAIDLEKKLSEFYKTASEHNNDFKDDYVKRAKDSESRVKKLERSRRENVTEIILEPIEDLNSSDFEVDLTKYDNSHVKEVEKVVTTFYELSYQKINVLESQRVLKKCYTQHKAFTT